MTFDHEPVCVVFFHLPGCEACAVVKPLFEKVRARYGKCVPSYTVDCLLHGEVATRHKVKSVPTTFVFRHGRKSSRAIGIASEAQLEAVFRKAARGLECLL